MFFHLRWPVLQWVGRGVAGVVGGQRAGLVQGPAGGRGRDQGRAQARGQPGPHRCGSTHRQTPGPAQTTPRSQLEPGRGLNPFVCRCISNDYAATFLAIFIFIPHASSLRMPREKKCLADTINEFELHDSP